jgi:hypothetical protein
MEIRAKYVYESIKFERGRDPRKSMDIGVTAENRDIHKMEDNFKKAFPEVDHTHTGEQHLHAPDGPHPSWMTITASLNNPDDGISVDDRKETYLDWFKTNTDYDEFQIDSAFDRRWHPWGDHSLPQEYSQQFTFHMRHKDYIRESVNFERGQKPSQSMGIGKDKKNYFNTVQSAPFIEMIAKHGDWPEGEALDILFSASELLGIPEKEVHVAVDDQGEYITTATIEEHMDDEIRDWHYQDTNDYASENFYFVHSTTGELYVCDYETATPYFMLGSPF